jgi:hypothetical protein
MIGEDDEDEQNKMKLIEETDEGYYIFQNIENGKTEKIPDYILNETNIYDITKIYRGVELTNKRFGKDIASNVSEYLGINPSEMRKIGERMGGRMTKRNRNRNRKKKRTRYRSRRYY